MLYMPKNYILVKDDEDISDFLQKDYKLGDFKENREVLKGLNVEKVWNKFLEQFS